MNNRQAGHNLSSIGCYVSSLVTGGTRKFVVNKEFFLYTISRG